MSEHDHELEEVEVVPVRGSYFVVITTALIVVVMAVFTWVMYGMAQKVFVLTDVMVEMNRSFKGIVADMDSMVEEIHAMNGELATMSEAVVEMNANVAAMNANLMVMTDDIGAMSENVATMTDDMAYVSGGVYYIGASMSRMTYDMGKATAAFTSPLSYMFANSFPF